MKVLAFNWPVGATSSFVGFNWAWAGVLLVGMCALGCSWPLVAEIFQHIASLSPISCILGFGTSKWTSPPA